MKKKKRNNRSSLHFLNFVQVNQPVDYRIDCYSCGRMYLQFVGDITAVGGNSVHRQVKSIGNLLLLIPLAMHTTISFSRWLRMSAFEASGSSAAATDSPTADRLHDCRAHYNGGYHVARQCEE